MSQRLSLSERFFEAAVALVLRHRWLVLLTVLAATAALGWVAARTPVLTTLRDILPEQSEALAQYDAARARFGADEAVLIAVESSEHFSAAGLARLEALTAAVEAHPLVEQTFSLTRAPWVRLEDGALKFGRFADAGSPAAIRQAVFAHEAPVRDGLISKDGRTALVLARLVHTGDEALGRDEVRAYVEAQAPSLPAGARLLTQEGGVLRALDGVKQGLLPPLTDLALAAGYPRDAIHLTGFPVLLGGLFEVAQRTINLLTPLCFVVVGLVMWLLLKRLGDTLIVLLCVAPACVFAVGLGCLAFGHVNVITAIAPVMVLVTGTSDVIHLLTQYRHERARGLATEAAIRVAFREVGVACALTSFTTLLGFGSMLWLPLAYARELGFFASVGVLCAYVLAFALTPVLLSFWPGPAIESAIPGPMARALATLARFLLSHRRSVLVAGLGATALSLGLTTLVRVDNDLTRKLAEDHPLRLATAHIVEAIGAGTELEILLDADRPGRLAEREVLKALHAIGAEAEALPEVAATRSLADVVRDLHTQLTGASPDALPTSDEAIAQYLLLIDLAGNRLLADLVDADRQHGRLILRAATTTAEQGVILGDQLARIAKAHLPKDVTATVGGLPLITARAVPVLVSVSLQGLAGSLAIMALTLGLLFRSIKVGVLSLVPNLAPVAAGLLTVYAATPQVDTDTIVFLTLCIGLAVDDTIHFLSRFHLEHRRGLTRDQAVTATLGETGHGMVRTSVILCAGFLVCLWSDYLGVSMVGYLLPATLVAALLLDLTLVPVMASLGWLSKKEPR